MSGFGSLEGWDGWRRNDGWKKHDGWLASDRSDDLPGALVDGLIRNREALLTGIASATASVTMAAKPQGTALVPKPAEDLPELNTAEELGQCALEVRTQVLVVELLQGLQFMPEEPDAASVRLGPSARAQVLARIVRPDVEKFIGQANEVLLWAPRRAERAPEILSQVGPQLAYWSSLANLSAERTPKTLELCNTAMVFASFVVQRLKHILSCRRPLAYNRRVQPMIPTPGFSALPSGHATEAFMMAHLLTKLCNLGVEDALLMQRQADRIATNRVIAGVHFPVDSIAGRMLGQTLAEYFVHRSVGGGWTPRTFDGTKVKEDTAFKYDEIMWGPTAGEWFKQNEDNLVRVGTRSKNLTWLWKRCDGGNA